MASRTRFSGLAARVRGWLRLMKRAWQGGSEDNVSLLAAGVAYFAFLALFPAVIAAISLWGLVLTPQRAFQQAEAMTAGLPPEAASIIVDQLARLAGQQNGTLGLGFAVTVALAIWSAAGGVSSMVQAVNLAYDVVDHRGFVKTRLLSLALTLGAIVFVVAALALVAAVPALVAAADLGRSGTIGIQIARFILLVLLVAAALAVVYRLAPDRSGARLTWVSPGALVGSALWLTASGLFSLYVTTFGSYDETYGSLAGVAILLLWLYLTSYVVLLGAEINAEFERGKPAEAVA